MLPIQPFWRVRTQQVACISAQVFRRPVAGGQAQVFRPLVQVCSRALCSGPWCPTMCPQCLLLLQLGRFMKLSFRVVFPMELRVPMSVSEMSCWRTKLTILCHQRESEIDEVYYRLYAVTSCTALHSVCLAPLYAGHRARWQRPKPWPLCNTGFIAFV